MLANDMKKGTVVRLKGGWRATIADNKKGLIRLADVEGYVRELGSIYLHDIDYVEQRVGQAYEIEPVEFTSAQAKQVERIKAMGF